jgi:hypothetical protein
MIRYVQRDAATGKIVGEFASPQPSIPTEVIDEGHPELDLFRERVDAGAERFEPEVPTDGGPADVG